MTRLWMNRLVLGLVGVILVGTAASANTGRSWVWLCDKGPATFESVREAEDAPVHPAYLAAVASISDVHVVSRWFNAVTVAASSDEIIRLRSLPFVSDVTPVRRFRRSPEPERGATPRVRAARSTALDYGPSATQMTVTNADALHELGLTGAGIRIAVFDDGFSVSSSVFDRLRPNLVATWDFTDGDGDVSGGYGHGTTVLSVIGAYAEGSLIGPAFDAEYLLARTEIAAELPVEEDNWAAAAEWAYDNGARIISSSVGYNYFDDDMPSSHTLDELDGKTAIITKAAQKAAVRGIVVVNVMGNERGYAAGIAIWQGKMLMPSDGDSVIAVGAMHADGAVAGFSSVGPTADGRIKPDICGMGVSVWTVSGYGNGTSYACPLVAGIAAQLLQAHPAWDPIAVRTALRLSGSRALAPDTLGGWGMADGLRALGADSAAFGRLADAGTGESVAGSFVRLYDGETLVDYATASQDGWFRFESLDPGSYALRGYWPAGTVGVETTLVLPTMPRELHLELRHGAAVAGRPERAGMWVSEPTPNPANPSTTIRFRLDEIRPGERVRMSVHTVTGQLIRALSVPADASGAFVWDGRDARGNAVASGVYFARVSCGDASIIRRMVVLR